MQKSTVGGILSIVAGALGLLGGLFLVLISIFFANIINDLSFFGDTTANPQQLAGFVTVFYGVLGAFAVAVGVLSIVGGIFSLQRKHWGWALAGAIGGCLSFLPVGVTAVVFVSMAYPEFNPLPPAAPPQPAASNPV
jgi:hypothetical protein